MNSSRIYRLVLALAAMLILPGPPWAMAEIRPSSDILLPYFEVDLRNGPEPGRTTLFAICNDSEDPVDVKISVVTNWGISVLDIDLTLSGKAVQTVNLRDWLISGRLPDGQTLPPEKIAFLKAVLTGKSSPDKHLYFATEVAPDLAVGALVFRTGGPDVLWGDFFVADPKLGNTEGETLVNLDPGTECLPECKRHGIRFLQDEAFDVDTELTIWADGIGLPSTMPDPLRAHRIRLDMELYDEAGRLFDTRQLKVMPLERLRLSDLDITEPFGWAELVTDTNAFVTGHYRANKIYNSALHAWCLPERITDPSDPVIRLDIRLEKLTNGQCADLPPGPLIPMRSLVQWMYIATNISDVPLMDLQVTDSDGAVVTCTTDTIDPGESIYCSAYGIAVACQHKNTAKATAVRADGSKSASNLATSHYFGEELSDLGLTVLFNGQHTELPGPILPAGEPLAWTYTVTNRGEATLYGVVLTDQHGQEVACLLQPGGGLGTVLKPGETMTCSATGTAQTGPHIFTATARGKPKCGREVVGGDLTAYTGYGPTAAIRIKKYTNGVDADQPPGPVVIMGSEIVWSYWITNIGNVALTDIQVTDNQGVAVDCPKTSLVVGESLFCRAVGTAIRGQYENVGTATGTPPSGTDVSAIDPSHYLGIWPAIAIVTKINGDDANVDCPTILQGSQVEWTYFVTNTGDQVLANIWVRDDMGLGVICPKTTLQLGESMTCTASGTAFTGPQRSVGTASGTPVFADTVTASDPSCYYGKAYYSHGCKPGYWRTYTESWPPTGYSTSQQVVTVFGETSRYPALGNSTLLAALFSDGGDGNEGAAGLLIRDSVTALLNASHPDVGYPWYPRSLAEVVSSVNAALASNDLDTMLRLAVQLQYDNGLSCPLD